MANALGYLPRILGLEENVRAIYAIIYPTVSDKYNKIEIMLLSDLIWTSIHRAIRPDYPVLVESVRDAISQYENMKQQSLTSAYAKRKKDEYLAKVAKY